MKKGLTEQRLREIANISLLVAALACLLLAVLRIGYAISFSTPWLITTSGSEEEGLFSVWKFTQGLPVYNDPLQIPYSASYFNWGFYTLYGSISSTVLTGLHLPAIWLPTICRLVTLAFGVMGCGLFFLACRESEPARSFWPVYLLGAWSLIAIIQPLCGFWLITTRPDAGAFVFELAGLVLILRYLRTSQNLTIIFAALALYAAWSFKQTSVSVFVGTCIAFLLLKNFRSLTLFVGTWIFLVAWTVWQGGPLYRFCAFASQAHCPLMFFDGLKNVEGALLKMPFIPLVLTGIAWLGFKTRCVLRAMAPRPEELVCLMTLLAALLLELIFTFKAGAADYYFLPLAVWSTLWLVFSAYHFTPRLRHVGLLLTSMVMILGISLVLLGLKGQIDRRAEHTPYAALTKKLADLPGPTLVTYSYGNLPWIQTHSPHFIIAYTYAFDRAAGVPHARGGWEGLLEQGYFHTLVTNPTDHLTAAELARYELFSQDAYFKYYRLKP